MAEFGDLDTSLAAVLVLVSALTSALTAAFGIGGGLTLIAVMGAVLPLPVAIPIHGIVQLGSNAGRMMLGRAAIDWSSAAWFTAGGFVGAVAGAGVLAGAPDWTLKLALGAFILAMVWVWPPLKKWRHSPLSLPAGGAQNGATALGGFMGGALSMVVGATGPMTSAVLSGRGLGALALVATFSLCMTLQHAVKTALFLASGFDYLAWSGLILAMIASGFVGTWAGLLVLKRLPAQVFRVVLNGVLTVVAAQLVISSLMIGLR